jgi:TetR/AcrR family transcriptional repressor of nem operon
VPRLIDAREQILSTAHKLIQTHGYSSFSYQDVSDKLGIKNASIHYHFPNKEDLAASLLRSYRARFDKWAERTEREKKSSKERLGAYFKMFEKIAPDAKRICLGGVFAIEWNQIGPKVRSELKSFHDSHRAWLLRVLEDGKANEELEALGSVDDTADLILSTVQGALQLARARGDSSLASKISKRLISTLTRKTA